MCDSKTSLVWASFSSRHQNATFKFKLKTVLLLVVVCWLRADDATAASEPTSSCTFDAETKRLWCSVGTLNGGRNNDSNIELQSANRAQHLTIQCSDDKFLESILRTNQFGYLPNLVNLDIKSCKIKRVPALAFSGLSGLKDLSITTHNSEWPAIVLELEQDSFTGLHNLRSLDLTQNNLWTVPPQTFCGLKSLTSLQLSSNFLQDVSDLGFSLSSTSEPCSLPLTTLDVSMNGLSKIVRGSFSQLQYLKQLHLEQNTLSVLDDGAFQGLNSLLKLNLASNQLVALPNQLFNATPRLQKLYLQNNSLSVIPPGIFQGLDQLLVLNVSNNQITNEWLSASTFSSLVRLVALDLSQNRLSSLDRSLLTGMPSLQVFYLKENQIHTVSPNTFINQKNLHILTLSNNYLESIHPRTFAGLSVLKALSLDNNRLTSLHRNVFRNCSSLQDLALSNNIFTSIPKAIKPLSLLRTLEVGKNQIRNIYNDSLIGLQNLFGLGLAGNGIEHIETGAFHPISTLQVLNLAHNSMAKLSQQVFQPLIELQTLRLDNNQLKDINGLLTAQSELRWLNISSNNLQWFDYANIPKDLQWLDLHNNQIEDLANYYQLSEGFNIKTLDASQNKIKRLRPLSIPVSLEHVILNNNRIDHIEPNTFADKPSLAKVELKSNLIRKLDVSSLIITPKPNGPLPEFALGDNPFFCDCEMEWLQKVNQVTSLQRRQHHHPRVTDLDNVQCTLNNNHKTQSRVVPIMQVRKQEFLCQYEAHCFALCMCCDFFACDCRMQCPKGCTCYHDSTWSANVIQCSSRQHTDIPPLIPMDATSLLLDGNNFTGTLISQAFIGRKRVQSLYLNNSMIAAISNQTFNGLTELEVLHLEDNVIQKIEGYEFENLTSLRELHLQRNGIVSISRKAFVTLVNLEVLQLHDNNLVTFPIAQLNSLQMLSTLSLSDNMFACQCQFVHDFANFVKTSSVRLHRLKNVGTGSVIYDISDVTCSSQEQTRLPMTGNVTCSDALTKISYTDENGQQQYYYGSSKVIPVAVAVTAICIIVAVTSITLFVFRTPLRVWLHSKYGVRLGCCTSFCCFCTQSSSNKSENRDRLYDAFVGYSGMDEDFVHQILAPALEADNPGYKLCLQHRDLPSNSSIADTFPGVSQLCAKHVLVVSRNYLDSEWTQIKYALKDVKKKWRFVIIMIEELTTLDLAAAPEFNLLMKAATVLRWGETGFWNKIKFYLPDSSRRHGTYRNNIGAPGHHHIPSSSSPTSSGSAMMATSPKSLLSGTPTKRRNNWSAYDNLPSNNSSTSTRSTTAAAAAAAAAVKQERVQLVSNPMDLLSNHQDQWSDDSAYSWHDHTYQSIHQTPRSTDHNIYQESDQGMGSLGDQALGSLDVMLPNGQMVAATLMRNHTGKIVPVVQVPTTPSRQTPRSPKVPTAAASSSNTTSSTSTTSASPPPTTASTTPFHQDHVTFPKTIVYKNDPVTTVPANTHRQTKPPMMPRQQHLTHQAGVSGFTNPNSRSQVIQHNSPNRRGGGGYLV